MEFPVMLYKDGGPHQRKGGSFNFCSVEDEATLEAKLAEGWVLGLEELDAGYVKPVVQPDDNAPPTRAELETKAKELGISFGKKTTDADLLALVTAKLGG